MEVVISSQPLFICQDLVNIQLISNQPFYLIRGLFSWSSSISASPEMVRLKKCGFKRNDAMDSFVGLL